MKTKPLIIFSSGLLAIIYFASIFIPISSFLQQSEVPHGTPLHRYLTTTGDELGVRLATGNFITDTVVFFIRPPLNTTIVLQEMHVTMRCPDGPLILSNYCNSPPLTNGISFGTTSNIESDNLLEDVLLIKSNADWARVCFEIVLYDFGPGGGPMSDDSYVTVRCIFGSELTLNGAREEAFVVTLADDFGGLTEHTFFIVGGVK